MISTRRQVIKEQDRYGGFEPSAKSCVYTDSPESGDFYSGFQGDGASEGGQAFNYTVVESPRVETAQGGTTHVETPRRSARVEVSPAPAVKTRRAKQNDAEFMPKINPKRARTEEVEVEEAPARTDRLDKTAANTRTKVILAVYVAAVIFLAAVVIMTGVAVANSGDAVSRLESDYALKNEAMLDQRRQLELLSDENYIRNEGYGLNMGEIKNPTVIEMSEGVTPVVYERRTNWFDKFCDWLSGILY